MKPPITSSINRRSLVRLIGATGLGVAATGCAGPGSGTSSSGAAAPSSGKPVGDISFAHWRAEDKAVLGDLITTFQSNFPGLTVRQDISPSNDYQSSALQRIRGGSVGDVFAAFRGAQFSDMVKAGLYTDLGSQAFVRNFDSALLTAGKSEGKQLGFPFQVVFNMPVTNDDIVATHTGGKNPTDWDSFLGLCDALKSKGLTPIAWPAGDPGNAGQLFNSMVMNAAPAADMCSQIQAGSLKCTDDWFVAMLKQYQQLVPYLQPNATGTAVEPCQQIFASGKAAMLATGSYHIAAVRGLGAKFPVGVLSPITSKAGKMTYEGVYNATFILGVNSASKFQAAAIAWIDFLTRPEHAAAYANGTGQHVTVRGVDYTNPDLQALAPWLTKKTILAPRFQFTNLDVRAAVEGACVAVVGGKSPEAAAADAQRVVDQQRQ